MLCSASDEVRLPEESHVEINCYFQRLPVYLSFDSYLHYEAPDLRLLLLSGASRQAQTAEVEEQRMKQRH